MIKELGKKGESSDYHMKSTKEFIRSIVYAGESSENYMDIIRVRIYKNSKRKTSMAISPDSGSVNFLLSVHTCK